MQFARRRGGNFNFKNLIERGIDGGVVHVDDFFALFAVGLLDSVFDCCYRLIDPNDVADLEKRRLHDDVDSRA